MPVGYAPQRLISDFWLWDFWPVQVRDGSRHRTARGQLWCALSAPICNDANARHDVARIRLLEDCAGKWFDHGALFKNGFTPGSREWSGSAVVDDGKMHVFFTAAGQRGEAGLSYEQRMFGTHCTLTADGLPVFDWSEPALLLTPGTDYAPACEPRGEIGKIEAFRDPAFFHDAATGLDHLLFTATLPNAPPHSGCVGWAVRATDGEWQRLPPLITARTLNTELERPHVVRYEHSYLLFFSTQSHVFAPNGPVGPTGLYGFVADALAGPWQPIGGHGLVLANPEDQPFAAYSWWVEGDGTVTAFVDRPYGTFIGSQISADRMDLRLAARPGRHC